MTLALLAYTVAIWAIGLAGVLGPLCLASYNKVILTICNSFAAGVMLSAGFVHLLHDAQTSLVDFSKSLNGFPASEFTCALAFIMVFFVETLFVPSVKHGEHHHLDHIRVDNDECFPSQWEWQEEEGQQPVPPATLAHAHTHPLPQGARRLWPAAQYGAVTNKNNSKNSSAVGGASNARRKPSPSAGAGPTLKEGEGEEEEAAEVNPHVAVRKGLLAHMQQTHVHHYHIDEHEHEHEHDHGKEGEGKGCLSPFREPPAAAMTDSHSHTHTPNHSHEHDHGEDHDHTHTLTGALCLLAALGFHSVIEGLGLATAASHNHGRDPTQVGVFIAILAHKGLAGITLGSTMLLTDVTQTKFLITGLIFSAATPLGVGLGVLISSVCKGSTTLGLMAAVAAGTFIHVASIEIIPSAFRDSSATQLAKLFSMTVGFLTMSALFLVA